MDASDFTTTETTPSLFADPSAFSAKRARHRDAVSSARASSEQSTSGMVESALDRAKALVRRELLYFIRTRGVGERVQSSDFVNWFDERVADVQWVRDADLDMRCLGGMFKALTGCGVLMAEGSAPNGGSESKVRGTKSQSSVRPIYRIVKLDFSKVPWGFDGRMAKGVSRGKRA